MLGSQPNTNGVGLFEPMHHRMLPTKGHGACELQYSEGEDEVNVFHVTAVHAQEHATTLDLLIAGETVHTTEEHPFFVKDKGWVEASKLAVGDLVRRGGGSYGIVEVVLIIDEPQVMYNLSVSHVATYLVGEGLWVVHNELNWLPGTPDIGQRIPGIYRFTDHFLVRNFGLALTYITNGASLKFEVRLS